MLKIIDEEIFGFSKAVHGMRNPMNSWERTDSTDTIIGNNDLSLMKKLVKAGTDHSKVLRFITVQCDIVAPLYWWKEFDTYKVGTVSNACSTMHTIHKKEFEINDFSHDQLLDSDLDKLQCGDIVPISLLNCIINALNQYRKKYIETKNKAYWWQIIQLLPSSYNQLRTVQLNYQVLANIYFARCNHKLDEWKTLCKWIKTLPYFKEIILN